MDTNEEISMFDLVEAQSMAESVSIEEQPAANQESSVRGTKKRFLTRIVIGETIHQKTSETIEQALNFMSPTDAKSVVFKITKGGSIIPIVFGSNSDAGIWVWTHRDTQEFFDKDQKLKVELPRERQKSKRQSYLLKLVSAIDTDEARRFFRFVENMKVPKFNKAIAEKFAHFKFESDKLKQTVEKFARECQRRDEEYKKRRTRLLVSCEKCGRCGEAHSNYQVRLDSNNIPYVICKVTDKRIDVLFGKPVASNTLHSLRDIMYGTQFKIVSGSDEEIARVKQFI